MNKQITTTIFFTFCLLFDNNYLIAKEANTTINNNKNTQSKSFNNQQLQQAKQYYGLEKYEEAIALLKAIIAQNDDNKLLELEALVNLSLVYAQTKNLTAVEETLEQIFSKLPNNINNKYEKKIYNFALEIKGQLELDQGKTQTALNTWIKSSEVADKRGDFSRFIYAKSKQIETLQTLGLYAQTRPILNQLESRLTSAPQDLVTAQAWKSLANISVKLGNLNQASNYIENALEIAQKNKDQNVIADMLNSQGNIEYVKYRQNFELGNRLSPSPDEISNYTKYYQQSAAITSNNSLKVTSQLSQLNFLIYVYELLSKEIKNRNLTQDIFSQISSLTEEIISQINSLPLQKSLINQRLNFSNNLLKLNKDKYRTTIWQQLTDAAQESQTLNYQRGKSEALGKLGKVYQLSNRLPEAIELTQKALYISETIQAPDLTYQWQWQLGRIYKQTNQRQQAIVAYAGAVYNLKSLRRELLGINSDLEFNFRENIEPVYRELVDITLQSNPTEAEVKLARQTIDDLQIAELDNYFQEACLNVQENNLEDIVDAKTALFYPIILDNRIEVIVSVSGKIKHYTSSVNQKEIEQKIQSLVVDLNNIENKESIDKSLNELYNYIIQPIAPELASAKIENLVFIPDGVLKNIPLAALYDGQQYLIENYNVSIAPSLNLVELETINRPEKQVLLAGLGRENPNNEETSFFTPLVNVEAELNSIKDLIPASKVILLDQTFTEQKLAEEIKLSYAPIVHIATHGQFSSELEQTYLLTWDEVINLKELENLFTQYQREKQSIDLLVLSACQTAVGDEKAALGLAGISIKAGAKSTVASLWNVDDKSTSLLMTKFYQELLNNQTSKTNALRQAQMEMIQSNQYNHPFYWSAFILVGNWL